MENIKNLLGKKVAIHCPDRVMAESLCSTLKDLGGIWSDGDTLNNTAWGEEKGCTVYMLEDFPTIWLNNLNSLDSPDTTIINYNAVDLEPKTTLNQLLEENETIAIHCPEIKNAYRLLVELDENNYGWINGYSLIDLTGCCWVEYREDTCYCINNEFSEVCYDSIQHYRINKTKIVEFDDIDFDN